MSSATRQAPTTWARRRPTWPAVGETLGRFHRDFPAAERLAADPVQLAHGYVEPADKEVAALVASCLAFGRASAIVAKARAALAPLGPSPAAAVTRLRPGDVPDHLRSWTHRWVVGSDLAWLLQAIGATLREQGSLAAAFERGLEDDGDGDLLAAMTRFALLVRGPKADQPRTLGARSLLPVPDGHAAAKRLCLFMRWMVRPEDGVDLGLWCRLGTRRLTVPLDTHVARIASYVGLTDRRTAGWAMAREITDNLRRFDADDPTRFDFALSHLGIMGGCPRRRDLRRCRACDLAPICRL